MYCVIKSKSLPLCANFSAMGSEISSAPLKSASPTGVTCNNLNKQMYVIVEIQGQQFKAEKDKFLYVHYLGEKVNEGDQVEFDRVLLVDADGAVKVGAPTVEGAKVVCEVKRPLVKGEKVIVFKKKRRKGYRRKNGHRQSFTQVVSKDVVA